MPSPPADHTFKLFDVLVGFQTSTGYLVNIVTSSAGEGYALCSLHNRYDCSRITSLKLATFSEQNLHQQKTSDYSDSQRCTEKDFSVLLCCLNHLIAKNLYKQSKFSERRFDQRLVRVQSLFV